VGDHYQASEASVTPDPLSRRDFLRSGALAGAAVSVGPLLASCGGEEEADNAATGKATINYLKGPNHENDLRFQENFAREFRARNPNITVQPSLYDWGNADTELTTAYASEDPPDVVYTGDSFWPKFAEAGALLDLSEYVNDPSYKERYDAIPQPFWDAMTYDGKIVGVPYFVGAVGFQYINLDIMKNAGVTDWNSSYDALRAAAKATRKGNVFGFGVSIAHTDFAYQDWMVYVRNAGGDILNEDRTGGGLDKPEVAAAFDLFRDLHFVDRSAPEPGLYDAEGLKTLFKSGRMAIYNWDAQLIRDLESDPPDFEWAITLPPPGPAARTAGATIGSLHVAAKSSAQDAAWEYVKYLTSEPVALEWFARIGEGDPVPEGQAPKLYGPGTPRGDSLRRKVATEFIPRGRALQPHPDMQELLRLTNGEYEQCVRGKTTGAEMAQAANARITEIVSGTA